MKKKIILLLAIVVNSILVYAQLDDDDFNELLHFNDLVILNEDTELAFNAKKADFIEIQIRKDITYQVLKNSGNQKISPLVLPERLDEIYQSHNSTILNEHRLFDQVHVISIDAWLVKPDGTEEEIEFVVSRSENQIVTGRDEFGTIYDNRYTLPQFSPGDIVHLKYSYFFPFTTNWQKLQSARVFLETKVPRKHFTYTLSHHPNLVVELNHFNVADPEFIENDKRKLYKWTFKNQPGCIDEPGSRPYTELPYFTICPKPYEFLYQHFDSFIEEFIPTWYILSFDREAKIRKAYVDDNIGVQNKDNHCFERIARRYERMVPIDSVGIARLRFFQRFIVDSTRYDNAYELYDWVERNRKRTPGCDLNSSFIREPNKEFIYANMLPKLGCQFFTAYLDDIRSGLISETYFAPLYDNEMMFAAITENDNIAFVLPKSDKRNLYCEELPFYYENVPVFLIFTYDYAGYKRNFNDVLRQVLTPGSNAKDNYRKVNSMVKYSNDKSDLTFNTRISLSGQYSTLTYPVYCNSTTDQSINPKYLEEVWDLGGKTEIKHVNPKGKQFYFPFKSSAEAEYLADVANAGENETIKLNIGKWIKHVYYPDFNTENRFTDFYSDFLGSDAFNYMIVFDTPVTLVDMPEPISISNDFGTYQFEIKQTDEQQFLISSFFLVKAPLVKKSEISQVAEIYDALEMVSNSNLRVEIEH